MIKRDRRSCYRVVFKDGTATYVSANSQRDAMTRVRTPTKSPVRAHRS